MKFYRDYDYNDGYMVSISNDETEATFHGHRVSSIFDMFSVLHEVGHIPNRISTARDAWLRYYVNAINLRSLQEEIKAWYEACKMVSIKYKKAIILFAMGQLSGYIIGFLGYSDIESQSKLWKEQKLIWMKEIIDLLASA